MFIITIMDLDHTVSPLPYATIQLTSFPNSPISCHGLWESHGKKHCLTDTIFTLSQALSRGKNSYDNYFCAKQSLKETWAKCYDMVWGGRDCSLDVFITTEIAQGSHTSNLNVRHLKFIGKHQALLFRLLLCTNIS